MADPSGGGGSPTVPTTPPNPPDSGGGFRESSEVAPFFEAPSGGSIISGHSPTSPDAEHSTAETPPPTRPNRREQETPTKERAESSAEAAAFFFLRGEFCCIGLNPEESMFEAIVSVTGKFFPDPTGPGLLQNSQSHAGDCSQGSLLRVGFWISEPSAAEEKAMPPFPNQPHFIGEASVHVNVNTRELGQRVNYAVRLLLDPDAISSIIDCADGARYPVLHCVGRFTRNDYSILRGDAEHRDQKGNPDRPESYDRITFALNSSNYQGKGLPPGGYFTKEAFIPFPRVARSGRWSYLARRADESHVFAGHAAILPTGNILFFGGPFYVDPEYAGDVAAIFDWENEILIKATSPTYTVHVEGFADVIQTIVLAGKVEVFKPSSVAMGDYEEIRGYNNLFRFKNAVKLRSIEKYVYNPFCAFSNALPDGGIFIGGGDDIFGPKDNPIHQEHLTGTKVLARFSEGTNVWANLLPQMHSGRWYAGSLTLGDGRVFIMDGHVGEDDHIEDPSGGQRHWNRDLEIFDPKTNQIEYIPNANVSVGYASKPSGEAFSGYFPRLFLLSNGNVFCATVILAAEDDVMRGSTAMWNSNSYQWEVVNKVEQGDQPSIDMYETGVMLPIRPKVLKKIPNVGPTTYRPEGILILDGAQPYVCYPLNTDLGILELISSKVVRGWVDLPQQWFKLTGRTSTKRRSLGLALNLPDGTIFFVGGINNDGRSDSDKYAVHEGEIYDPETGVWTTTAPISEGRNYHTTAVLLRDGRVLVGGSHPGGNPSSPRLLSFEIFSPDYLFRGPRPIFSIDKSEVSRGTEILIRLGSGWRYQHIDPRSICLIRCYTVTHAFATDQRCIFLDPYFLDRTTVAHRVDPFFIMEEGKDPFQTTRTEFNQKLNLIFPTPDQTEFSVRIPSNSGLVPPGFYMLFISSQIPGHKGVPSISKMIKVV